MRYQERVRRDWTASLRLGIKYSIAQVNNELIKECRDEISGEIQVRHNVSGNLLSSESVADPSSPVPTSLHPIHVVVTWICSAPPHHAPLLHAPLRSLT